MRVTMPVHCAPPENTPTPVERDTCRPWLARELDLLRPTLRVAVALGAFAWQSLLPALDQAGWAVPRPRPRFGHGAHAVLAGNSVDHGASELHPLGCYRPSQRNTFTGTLTADMLEGVLRQAIELAASRPGPGSNHISALPASSASRREIQL